ncbi:hypothetical protein FRX31_003755, partial [Thalictrum thalictroides]
MEVQFEEVVNVFNHINIPILTAIKHLPSNVKVLEEMFTVERKTNISKSALVAKDFPALFQHNIVVKYKDTGKATILCKLGEKFM